MTTHEQHSHIVPVKVYLRNFFALMFLMFLTVFAAYFHLGGALNLVVALTIATTKAVLIILYFMHVRYSSKLTWVFAGGAFFWLLIMFVLLLMDYLSRHMQPYGTPWQ